MLLEWIDAATSAHRLAALCDRTASADAGVESTVRTLIADVRDRGDQAVRELTERFDRRSPHDGNSYEIPASQWAQAVTELEPGVEAALTRAAARIRAFHALQVEESYRIDSGGVELALRVQPLARVGLYVPGGTARYPSSVLMNAIPAKLAGVGEIIMVTPGASPATLAAAHIAGVDRLFEIGGAQAVAALAYGTESVPRVDKIVGPGNQWVAAAKRLVFGDVDIDSVAGPSEVLIIADDTADPGWVAADLLAQAEHDVEARPILVTTCGSLVKQVERALAQQLANLSRSEIARKSLESHGVAVVVADLQEAVRFANDYAPEHLELLIAEPEQLVDQVVNAGAIFIGRFTPEAAGDYLAGPNHVLPTAGAARYASPLGVYDFRKRVSLLRYTGAGLAAQSDDIVCLARVEGLDAHAHSASIRSIAAAADAKEGEAND